MVVKSGSLDISMEAKDTPKEAKDGTLERTQACTSSLETCMIHFLDSRCVVIL